MMIRISKSSPLTPESGVTAVRRRYVNLPFPYSCFPIKQQNFEVQDFALSKFITSKKLKESVKMVIDIALFLIIFAIPQEAFRQSNSRDHFFPVKNTFVLTLLVLSHN